MRSHAIEIVERRKVELLGGEAKKVAIAVIREALDMGLGDKIEDGKLTYEKRVGGGGHSWFETVVVREATEADKAALLVIAAIRKAE